MKHQILRILALAVVPLTSLGCSSRADAQTEPPSTTAPAPASKRGTVARVLVNPHGDLHGLILADGTIVRFPPSPAARSTLASGQSVRVEGLEEGGAVRADRVMSAAGADLLPTLDPDR